MKRSNILILFLLLLFIPSFQSCGDDETELTNNLIVADFVALGNVVIIEGDAFYILLHNGNPLDPKDSSRLKYKPQDGERVWVYYNEVEEKVAGYTFTIEIAAMDKLIIQEIEMLTEANAEEIGNDPVTIEAILIGGGFINIEFKYYGKTEHIRNHTFNLVINEATRQENEDFFELEFRHNSRNDSYRQWQGGIMAFKMETELADVFSGKGLHIRVNKNMGGEQVIVVDFSEGNIIIPQK
ncbi:MAG: NigD-like protein [Bacteroides sp.]|nr:NigD-like protein [Bacteroides sp.]